MLKNGSAYRGRSFGAPGEAIGEVVFNTSMTGYQEILSDPSYRGQIVTMTYPLIGNYGVNEEDIESRGLFLSGMVVREYSRNYSNWRGVGSLDNLLRRRGVMGISEIDTRALTRTIREHGAMTGIISTVDFERDSLLAKVVEAPEMIGQDYVTEVSCDRPWQWQPDPGAGVVVDNSSPEPEFELVAFDFGVKYNILRSLAHRGCRVQIVPATAGAEEILALKPHGLLLSNGPGDPAALPKIVETVGGLLKKMPVFGVCLGHQLLALALGGSTFKLPFGHHGANHPVKNLMTGRIEITAQNHGFAVDPGSLPMEVEVTHVSLYDGTVEGLRHHSLPVFSVQYHPEAAPGPHDSGYLFDEFVAGLASVRI
jgi:carbamoyl-phosphate synthase small subunit